MYIYTSKVRGSCHEQAGSHSHFFPFFFVSIQVKFVDPATNKLALTLIASSAENLGEGRSIEEFDSVVGQEMPGRITRM